eukprot:TRINITY_DN4163_c0_g2_i5.p1 TRINITY_DN4163_c0_g2~~TRINITY_DN4163_c0_g2_i5.p1  ORF type:complete len:716 (-),score=53.39 TRINITY_DN4163_c0_g2_i5:818-2965(-)
MGIFLWSRTQALRIQFVVSQETFAMLPNQIFGADDHTLKESARSDEDGQPDTPSSNTIIPTSNQSTINAYRKKLAFLDSPRKAILEGSGADDSIQTPVFVGGPPCLFGVTAAPTPSFGAVRGPPSANEISMHNLRRLSTEHHDDKERKSNNTVLEISYAEDNSVIKDNSIVSETSLLADRFLPDDTQSNNMNHNKNDNLTNNSFVSGNSVSNSPIRSHPSRNSAAVHSNNPGHMYPSGAVISHDVSQRSGISGISGNNLSTGGRQDVRITMNKRTRTVSINSAVLNSMKSRSQKTLENNSNLQNNNNNNNNNNNQVNNASANPAANINNAALNNNPDEKACKICFDENDGPTIGKLIAPCKCAGSVRWIHDECLKTWLVSQNKDINTAACELCHHPYKMEFTYKIKFYPRLVLEEGILNLLTLIFMFLLVLGLSFVMFLLFEKWGEDKASLSEYEELMNNQDPNFDEREWRQRKANVNYRLALIIICGVVLAVLVLLLVVSVRESFFLDEVTKWKIFDYVPGRDDKPAVPKVQGHYPRLVLETDSEAEVSINNNFNMNNSNNHLAVRNQPVRDSGLYNPNHETLVQTRIVSQHGSRESLGGPSILGALVHYGHYRSNPILRDNTHMIGASSSMPYNLNAKLPRNLSEGHFEPSQVPEEFLQSSNNPMGNNESNMGSNPSQILQVRIKISRTNLIPRRHLALPLKTTVRNPTDPAY